MRERSIHQAQCVSLNQRTPKHTVELKREIDKSTAEVHLQLQSQMFVITYY
jgi:hypothetical protein